MSVGSVGRDSFGVHSYPYLAGPASPPAADVSSTTSLLVEGDLGAQLAGLVIQNSKIQRDANHQLRDVQEHALAREEAAQVQALHDKADDTRWAGWVSGVFGMASGGCTIMGSFAGSESAAGQRWKGSGEIIGAFGKGADGMARGAVADDETRAQSHKNAAEFYGRALNATRDSLRESQDLLERVMDFYKGYQQGAGDAAKTSVGR
ncbi:MAG: hypothetical protein ABW133_13980 [Polyangiaceae bacterium]